MSDTTVNGYVRDGFDMSIAQLWGSGPKLTIQCGGCKKHYEKRVNPGLRPIVICPHCGKLNKLDITV
jgi:hypothetical protein